MSFEGLRAQRGVLDQERRDVSADDRCSDGDCVELLAAAKAPTPADLAKGDPGGTLTGNIADITVTDAKAGPTMADAGTRSADSIVPDWSATVAKGHSTHPTK